MDRDRFGAMHSDVAGKNATLERPLLLFCIGVVFLLPAIWSRASVTGQDEYFLSFRTVLEMRERGDWLVPWVNGEVRLQKPPLLYWAMLLCMEVFGPTIWAARLPTVLAGAAFAVAVGRLARQLGLRASLATLIALSAAGVATEARRAMFDLPVACLATWAVLFAWDWWRSGRMVQIVVAGALLAAASMTKGPIALWFFAAPGLAGLLVRRGPFAGAWWHIVVGAVVYAALALPWPLYVANAYPRFLAVMAEQAENRQFGLESLRRLPNLLAALLGLCVPWALMVLRAGWSCWRGRDAGERLGRWLVAWALIGLIPFALMNSFERYVLGLVAPLAVLVAQWLAQAPSLVVRRHLMLAWTLLALPTIVFGGFAAWFGLSYWAPILAILTLGVAFRMVRSPRPSPSLAAFSWSLLLSVLLGVVYPTLGINQLPADLPSDLAERGLATFGRPQPGMVSIHAGRSALHMDVVREGLPARLAAFRGYLFVRDEDLPLLRQSAAIAGKAVAIQTSFRSFYSRRAWLRFAREGVGAADWWAAIASRSPDGLQPLFHCVTID